MRGVRLFTCWVCFFFQMRHLGGGGALRRITANGDIAKVYERVPPFDGNNILLPYGPGGIPYLMPVKRGL